MNRELLDFVCCPLCKGELRYVGVSDSQRLVNGAFECSACQRQYPVVEEIGILLGRWDLLNEAGWNCDLEKSDDMQLYERTARNSQNSYQRRASRQAMVDHVAGVGGLVIDVGTGPGGSICFPLLSRHTDDMQLVACDLGEPVMRGLYRYFKQKGLAQPFSCLVFDARQMPFRDGCADAVTSVVGFGNIRRNVEALHEAFRVLRQDGHLVIVERSYEPGSRSADVARTSKQNCFATLDEAIRNLETVGFAVEDIQEDFRGQGKSDAGDGMPIGNDSWVHHVFYARKRG